MKKYITKQSNIKGAGKGLFTNAFFKKGEVIGLAHVNGQPTKEVGSNHNHNEKNPTANNIKNGNKRYLIASKNLKPGEEITTNYRLQPELEQPEDFEKKKSETMTPQKDGYRTYSPFKNLPYIDVESDTIDSDNIVYDLKLKANNGLTKFIKKNTGLHTLPGAKVIREIPVKRKGGALLTKKVTCKSCGWKWDAEDGGKDITTCHECGGQGLVHAQDGGLNKFVGGGLQNISPCQADEYWDGEKCVKRTINYYNADEDLTKNAEYQDWLIRQSLWQYSDLPYNKQKDLSSSIIRETDNYNKQLPYDFQGKVSDFYETNPETEDFENNVNIGPYGSKTKFIESLTNAEAAKHSYRLISDNNQMVNNDVHKNTENFKPFDKSNAFFQKYPPSSWSYLSKLSSDPTIDLFSGNWNGSNYKYTKPNTSRIEDNVNRTYLKKFYPELTDEQIDEMVKADVENPSYITNEFDVKKNRKWVAGQDVEGHDIAKGQDIFKDKEGLIGYKTDEIAAYISQYDNYTPSWAEPKELWLKKQEELLNLPTLKPGLIKQQDYELQGADAYNEALENLEAPSYEPVISKNRRFGKTGTLKNKYDIFIPNKFFKKMDVGPGGIRYGKKYPIPKFGMKESTMVDPITGATVNKQFRKDRKIQKETGLDRSYYESSYDDEGNYIPGELENAETEGRRINFKGQYGRKDRKAQEQYNLEYDEYEFRKKFPTLLEDLNITYEDYINQYVPKKQYGGNKDAMTGMMKARLAYANEFGNPAAERMINLPDNPYQFDNGDTGSHYMASMDNYAVPQIQDENGVLQLGDYGPESNEAIRFDSDEDANYFAENYKDVSPGFLNEKQYGGINKFVGNGEKVYMYPGRKNTYYKQNSNGTYVIKNKETGWKYTPIKDPTGSRTTLLNENRVVFNKPQISTKKPNTNFLNKAIADNITAYGFWSGGNDYVAPNKELAAINDKYKKLNEEANKKYNYVQRTSKKQPRVKFSKELKEIYIKNRKEYIKEISKIAYNIKTGEKIKVAKDNNLDTYSKRVENAYEDNFTYFPSLRPNNINASQDALSIHQGQPQKYNSFKLSKYKPTITKNDNVKNYEFRGDAKQEIEDDLFKYRNSDFINSKETFRQVKNSHVAQAALKDFQYSKGKDDRGKYVAYYDKNNYGNILDIIPNSKTFDIYGRVYYKDYGNGINKKMYYSNKELSELNANKSNFDFLPLQKELNNRGYKFSKSTTKEGTFDGIYRDEIKNALLDYQNKNKKQGGFLNEKQYGGISNNYIEADLDEDEIEEYRRGGYIVEEIDTYQNGGAYTVKGSKGLYKKVNGKWQVDWNRSGKYQPLSKGDVKARTAILDKMAKPVNDGMSKVSSNSSDNTKVNYQKPLVESFTRSNNLESFYKKEREKDLQKQKDATAYHDKTQKVTQIQSFGEFINQDVRGIPTYEQHMAQIANDKKLLRKELKPYFETEKEIDQFLFEQSQPSAENNYHDGPIQMVVPEKYFIGPGGGMIGNIKNLGINTFNLGKKVLSNPYVSGGLNAYFAAEGINEFRDPNSLTRKSTNRAWNNPTPTNIKDALYDNSINSLNFIGLPFTVGFQGSKNVIKGFKSAQYTSGFNKIKPGINKFSQNKILLDQSLVKTAGELPESLVTRRIESFTTPIKRKQSIKTTKDLRKTLKADLYRINKLKKENPGIDINNPSLTSYNFEKDQIGKIPEFLKGIEQNKKSTAAFGKRFTEQYADKMALINKSHPVFQKISKESPQYIDEIVTHLKNPVKSNENFLNDLVIQSNTFARFQKNNKVSDRLIGKSFGRKGSTMDVEGVTPSDYYGTQGFRIQPTIDRAQEIFQTPFEKKWSKRIPEFKSDVVLHSDGMHTGKHSDFEKFINLRRNRLDRKMGNTTSYDDKGFSEFESFGNNNGMPRHIGWETEQHIPDYIANSKYFKQPKHLVFESPTYGAPLENFDAFHIGELKGGDYQKFFEGTSKGFKDGGATNDYIELDLTPEEIQRYKNGGYVVEEIDTYQKGGVNKKGKSYDYTRDPTYTERFKRFFGMEDVDDIAYEKVDNKNIKKYKQTIEPIKKTIRKIPTIETKSNFELDLKNRLQNIAKENILKKKNISKVEPIKNSLQITKNNNSNIKNKIVKPEDSFFESTYKEIKSFDNWLDNQKKLFNNGLDRKLQTWGIVETKDKKVIESPEPINVKDYYKNPTLSQTILNVNDQTNRQFKQQTVPTSNLVLGSRNRGQYQDIESDGLEFTTFHPFSKAVNIKPYNKKTNVNGINDDNSVFALDNKGVLHTGIYKNLKNNKNWKFSKTFMNKIVSIDDISLDGARSGNPKFWQPQITILENNKLKKGALNILTKKGKVEEDYYGSILGGRVVFVNPLTKEQTLVSGSVSHIKKEFKRLKGNSKYLEAWSLDNGTYSRGLSYKDGKLTKQRLVNYDAENTSGGNGLYIKKYNVPVNKFKETYVYDMPNVRTKKDNSYKAGHKLKNEIKNFVLHHTAYDNPITNEAEVKKQFMTPGQNSSHVVIEEDGSRTIYASPEQVSFHAGKSKWNGREDVNDFSIGVEFQGDTQKKPLTDEQVISFVEYYVPIAKKYNLNLKSIITHEQIRNAYIIKHANEKGLETKPDITYNQYKRILNYMKAKGIN